MLYCTAVYCAKSKIKKKNICLYWWLCICWGGVEKEAHAFVIIIIIFNVTILRSLTKKLLNYIQTYTKIINKAKVSVIQGL